MEECLKVEASCREIFKEFHVKRKTINKYMKYIYNIKFTCKYIYVHMHVIGILLQKQKGTGVCVTHCWKVTHTQRQLSQAHITTHIKITEANILNNPYIWIIYFRWKFYTLVSFKQLAYNNTHIYTQIEKKRKRSGFKIHATYICIYIYVYIKM